MAASSQDSTDQEIRPNIEPRSALKSQESTASHATKVKAVTLRVFTMKQNDSHEITFASGRLTTAEQIMERMLEKLGMPKENENVFSIWLTSRYLQLQLKSYHLPCKLFKRWRDLLSQYTLCTFDEACQDEPILSFQRNAFFPLHEERKLIKDYHTAVDLLYHEAVFNVTRSRYPMTDEELHTLAGYQAAILSSEREIKNPTPVSFKSELHQFYPPYIIAEMATPKKKSGRLFRQKSVEGKHEQFMDAFSKSLNDALTKLHKVTDVYELKLLYLQLCWHKTYYGSVMFQGQIKRPFKPVHLLTYSDKLVTMAVNKECIHIISASTPPPEILIYLTYDQLSWFYDEANEEAGDCESCLWIEFDSVDSASEQNVKVAKRLQIFSRQAPMMDAMISRCVAEIDQQEEKLKQKRVEQGYDAHLPEVSITSGTVQRQQQNYKEHKLQCEVYTQGGDILESGFSLSKVWKRKKTASASSTDQHSVPLVQSASTNQQQSSPTTQHSTESTSESKYATDL